MHVHEPEVLRDSLKAQVIGEKHHTPNADCPGMTDTSLVS